MTSTPAILRMRRDAASNWSTANPVIESGQLGFETDTGFFKLGDGAQSWLDLPYISPLAVSAGTQLASIGTLTFANSNGVSFGLSTGTNGSHTLTASAAAGAGVAIAVGTDTQGTGTVEFATSPTVTFGYAGGTITASAAGGAADGVNILAAGTQTANTTGTVLFQNSNGLSFGMSNSSVITGSYTVPTVPAQPNVSAGTTNVQLGNLSFSNGSGVSFGLNGSTVTASVATNYLTSQSNQALSGSNGSFAFQTATFGSSNGIHFYTTNGSLVASHNALTSQSNQAASASNGSFTFQTLNFSNANNVTFGTSAGGIVTASVSPGGAGDGVNIIAAGTQTANTTGSVLFQNSNGISFGMSNNSVVTASYTVPTIPTPEIRVDAGTVADNFSAISFGNSPTLTWTANTGGGGDISISATPYIVVNAGGATGTVSQLSFADSKGVSFGLNAGTITATVATNYLTSQSNQALSGSNGSFTFQTATFGSSNGLHFYTTNGSLVGSYTVPTQSVQPVAVSGSNGSFAFSTVTFGNLNGLSFYSSNGSMVASHNGLTTQSAQAASASNGSFTFETLNFSNANNVTFGTSAGGIVTASVNAAGGGYTVSGSNPHRYAVLVFANIWNASYLLQPLDIPCNLAFNRVVQPVNFSHATNSTGTMTITGLFALYTLNGSTLSSVYSQSASQTLLASGTASSSNWVGPRLMSFPWTTTVSPGTYVLGVGYRTTSGGANMSISIGNVSRVNSSMSGMLGVGSANSAQWENGWGIFSASTSNVPGTVGLSQITGVSSAYLRQPALFFASNGIY